MNTLKFGNGEWYGKKDTILAYNDENSNFKPLAFNFERNTSATRINKDGLIETVGSGEPRIDFSNDVKGALLLEPSRTNLITNSNNLTTWNGAAMTRTLVDDLINPSNGLDASKLLQSASGGYAWLSRTFTGNETFSAFVKKDSSNFARLYAANNTVYFDIVNGTIETEVGSDITDKSIIDYGNGWFRISMSVNSTAASYVRIYPASSGSSSSGTNSLFVYGAQLEQGSYATSYIPTQGGAVTRVAESCEQTVPDGIINSSEGVLYFESKALTDTDDSRISLSDGNANGNNRISFSYSPNINTAYCIVQLGGVQAMYDLNVPLTNQTEYKKFAIKWKSGDLAFWVDGVKLISNNGIFTAGTMDKLRFNNASGGSGFKAKVKDVRVYNQILTDQELINLTTI